MQTARGNYHPNLHPSGKDLYVRSESPDESSLVVSIHDVSPVTRDSVELILKDLISVGVPVTSLLVIPDHHHAGKAIDQDSSFADWLRKLVASGHEVVLHGYYHLRHAKPDESLKTRLITRSYTAGEGEFHDLTFEEASVLLRRGTGMLRSCGVDSSGFIAPAWLLGEEAERAVRCDGFDYTTRIGSVIDFKGRKEFAARSMVYSVRAPWRRLLSLIWNTVLFDITQLRNVPLMRMGLHPPDWHHSAIRRHALKIIEGAVVNRKIRTYKDWLDLTRLRVHERRFL